MASVVPLTQRVTNAERVIMLDGSIFVGGNANHIIKQRKNGDLFVSHLIHLDFPCPRMAIITQQSITIYNWVTCWSVYNTVINSTQCYGIGPLRGESIGGRWIPPPPPKKKGASNAESASVTWRHRGDFPTHNISIIMKQIIKIRNWVISNDVSNSIRTPLHQFDSNDYLLLINCLIVESMNNGNNHRGNVCQTANHKPLLRQTNFVATWCEIHYIYAL